MMFDVLLAVVIIATAPFFIFPSADWIWAVFGIPVLWLLRGFSRKKWLTKNPLDLAIASLVSFVFIGSLRISDIAKSTPKLTGLAFGVIAYYAIIEVVRNERRLKIALVVFLVMGFAVAVVGTVDRDWRAATLKADFVKSLPTIPSVHLGLKGAESGVNPNAMSGTLLFFIPLGLVLGMVLSGKKNGFTSSRRRIPLFAMMIIILAFEFLAVILSGAVGVWIATLFSILAIGLGLRRARPVAIATAAAMVLLILGVAGIFGWQSRDKIWSNVASGLNERTFYWSNGLKLAQSHPLTGVGLNQLRWIPPFDYDDSHAHNQFIHTAAEIGIPGLVSYLALLFGAAWMTIAAVRSALPHWMRVATGGLALGQLGFHIFGLADAIPLGAKTGLFFWVSNALIASIYLYGRNQGFLSPAESVESVMNRSE